MHVTDGAYNIVVQFCMLLSIMYLINKYDNCA